MTQQTSRSDAEKAFEELWDELADTPNAGITPFTKAVARGVYLAATERTARHGGRCEACGKII